MTKFIYEAIWAWTFICGEFCNHRFDFNICDWKNETEYTLIEYINTSIQNDSQVNALGSQYKIEISNRLGTKISVTNNTPNEQIELNIVDYSNFFLTFLLIY